MKTVYRDVSNEKTDCKACVSRYISPYRYNSVQCYLFCFLQNKFVTKMKFARLPNGKITKFIGELFSVASFLE